MFVTVYGIGEVGSTLASLLSCQLSNSVINLIDTSQTISGRILDLQHAACMRHNDVFFNRQDLVVKSDFIFFSAGTRSRKNADRNSIAAKNKALVRSIFSSCEFKKNATVIAMSNPVDLVAEWIAESCDNRVRVIGTGTAIDTGRLNFLLSRKTGEAPEKVDTLVLGEHGELMVPVFSKSTIDGKPTGEILPEKTRDEISIELVNAARNIRSTEPATKYGIAACALKIMNALSGSDILHLPLSVQINAYYKSLLGINEDLYFSLPCSIGNGTIQIRNLDGFTKKEIQSLQKSAANIKKVYRNVK